MGLNQQFKAAIDLWYPVGRGKIIAFHGLSVQNGSAKEGKSPSMERALGSPTFAPIHPSRRATARVALVDLKEPARALLAECFRQFNIETAKVDGNFADRLQKEKFEGCVVRLGPTADAVMESARNSPANSRLVLYGVGGTAQDALHYSRFGLNAIFREPLERQAALKLVRSTHLLVMHEFRRYIRIPVATEVGVSTSDGKRLIASSIEISSGGMSLRSKEGAPNVGANVEISFALLTLPRVWVNATVLWRKDAEHTFGIRFDAGDERRFKIKDWIVSCVEQP